MFAGVNFFERHSSPVNFFFRSGNASFSFGMEMSGPAFKRSTFEVNLENRDRDEREQLLQGLGVQ